MTIGYTGLGGDYGGGERGVGCKEVDRGERVVDDMVVLERDSRRGSNAGQL